MDTSTMLKAAQKAPIILATTILLIGALAASAGGPKPGSGYFFLSGYFADSLSAGLTGVEKGTAEKIRPSAVPDSSHVHGPFRSMFSAKRAMRKHKKEVGGLVYFSRIFKL